MRNAAPGATVVLLARHGHTHAIGDRLVGRLPGVQLSAEGRADAMELTRRLAGTALAAVYRVLSSARCRRPGQSPQITAPPSSSALA